MSSNMNNVSLIGRLTKDMELKYTNTGTAIGKFGLAVNRGRIVNEQWQDEVSFFNIVIWGKRAESLSKYMTKGLEVGITGELHQNRWTNENGQARSTIEIIVRTIDLLRKPAGQQNINNQVPPIEPVTNAGDPYDDIPF